MENRISECKIGKLDLCKKNKCKVYRRLRISVKMDGEYDIFGNPVKPHIDREPIVKEGKAAFSLSPGDPVEVKEGGQVYRLGTIVKIDADLGSVDVSFEGGDTESGIPLSLCRQPLNSAMSSPPGMSAPARAKDESAVPNSRRRKESGATARRCYELIKTFSESEQEAAFAVLQQLDSIRQKP